MQTDQAAKEIRWGIVGSGAIAARFLQGLRHVPSASCTALWGRNRATAARLAAAYGAVSVASFADLLATAVDAIYIGTHPDTHAAYSTQALRAGKAVLCEKPVAINLRELDEVLRVAREMQCLFMEAMKPAFYPVFRNLLDRLRDKPVGAIRSVQSGYGTIAAPGSSAWDLKAGGGSLMGIGVYHAWLVTYWMGAASSIHAIGRVRESGVDAFAACMTEHPQGVGQFFSRLDLQTEAGASLAAEGGAITLHDRWWNPEHITIRYADGEIAELREPIEGGGLNYETSHFCDLLRAGAMESPVITHANSRNVMHLLDRAREAIGVRFAPDTLPVL